MSRPRNPNGVRRAHTRNGRPVRSTSIKGRQAPKRRLNAAARRRAQRKPMLAGAAGLLGLGALDAILNGRWGGFLVLGGLAVGLTVTHYGWQWHKKRQASKPAKPSRPQVQQRREALEKARAAHQPEPAAPLQISAASEARSKQRRYDEMQRMLARQRKRGQTEMVWPNQYEEFFDGPGQLKPRPSGKPEPAVAPKVSNGAQPSAPTSHAEWQDTYGKRCDCTECRAKRKAESKATKAEAVSLR